MLDKGMLTWLHYYIIVSTILSILKKTKAHTEVLKRSLYLGKLLFSFKKNN